MLCLSQVTARRICFQLSLSVLAHLVREASSDSQAFCFDSRAQGSGAPTRLVVYSDNIWLTLLDSIQVSDTSKVGPSAHFSNDLGLDSLDTVEVVMAIEEEFSIEIPDKDADAIHSGKSLLQSAWHDHLFGVSFPCLACFCCFAVRLRNY